MALKVDITRAFDTVSWGFLHQVLRIMNFYVRFIEMVTCILNSARLSILINGSPHGYFSCYRGVRQGDPLSPLLFCLAEEALIRWIDFSIESSHFTIHRRLPMGYYFMLMTSSLLSRLLGLTGITFTSSWLIMVVSLARFSVPRNLGSFTVIKSPLVLRGMFGTTLLLQLILSP